MDSSMVTAKWTTSAFCVAIRMLEILRPKNDHNGLFENPEKVKQQSRAILTYIVQNIQEESHWKVSRSPLPSYPVLDVHEHGTQNAIFVALLFCTRKM